MSDSGRLEGAVAIVTAGAQGIGEATAKIFAREGATVAIVDNNEAEANRVAGEIDKAGGSAFVRLTDVTDLADVKAMVDDVVARCGTVDILVNGAGGWSRIYPINEIPDEEWDRIISLNLSSAFYCTRAVSGIMMERKSGRIISISSGAGISPNPHAPSSVPYGAAKAGLIGFSKLLARELGPYNITVNCVAPGTCLTPRVRKARTEEDIKRIAERNPLRALIEPEDAAESILYLASKEARYVTGVTLNVNAGNIIV